MKFISDTVAKDADTVARFSREASAAAAVKSPHVVQVHDHGVTGDGTPFIVMELLEGRDLARHLEDRGHLPLAEVDVIVNHVCKALSRAHDVGIVHRDIKPQNIFLCDAGDGEIFVKLLDFGVAKKADALTTTRTGASVGTPFYMSPEQVVGEKTLGPRSDLWSLGVVAFEALTGRRPFAGETVGALALAICHGPVPVPSECRPDLGRAVDPWFAKACARDPSGRFASAKEMSEVLHLALARSELGLATTMDSQREVRRVISTAPPPAEPSVAHAENAPTLLAGATTGVPVSSGRPRAGAAPTGPTSRPRAAYAALGVGVVAASVLALRARAPDESAATRPPASAGAQRASVAAAEQATAPAAEQGSAAGATTGSPSGSGGAPAPAASAAQPTKPADAEAGAHPPVAPAVATNAGPAPRPRSSAAAAERPARPSGSSSSKATARPDLPPIE